MLAGHPRSPGYHVGMASLYEASGEAGKAEQEYKTALELDPTSPDLHKDLGLFYYGSRNYPRALEEFMAAAALAPTEPVYKTNSGDAAKAMGEMEAASGDVDAANRHFAQALSSYNAAADVDPAGEYHGYPATCTSHRNSMK